jgi:lysozyme family protein
MFERAVALVLEHEGLLSDDAHDDGGLTKYGISQRGYPQLDIRALTRDQAIAIYRRDYWDACRCGEMPWWAALIAFDCAVNQGGDAARRLLQTSVGAKADGVIGAATLAAIRRAEPRPALAQFLSHRALRYARHADWDRFGRGWMVRLFSLQPLALEM